MTATRLTDMHLSFVSLVPRGADPDAHIVLAKSADDVTGRKPELQVSKTEGTTPMSTDATSTDAATAASTAAPAADVSKTDAAATPAPASTDASVEKGDSVSISKADLDELRKTADLAKALRTESEIAKSTARVRKEYAGLPIDADAMGAALYRLGAGGHTQSDLDLVDTALKAAAGIAKNAARLTGEIGTAARAEDSRDGTLAKIAADIRKAEPTLTTEQAFARAMSTAEGKALYEELETERQSRAVGTSED